MYKFERARLFSRKMTRLTSAEALTPADFDAIANEVSARPLTAQKVGFVAARRAEKSERVETRSEGHETTNTAQAGDWIVTNLTTSAQPVVDSRGRRNIYVIGADKFDKLYEATEHSVEGSKVYKAKGEVIAFELPGKFNIQAPWGERQMGETGYLVRNSSGEVYCIEKSVFHQTYDLLGPGALRLRASGRKRMLSLDGGGVKGMLTLGFLERLEEVLRERHDNPKLVLADYFDLIGGTSVGAILATQLALGEEVAAVKALFEEWCPDIFKPPSLWRHPLQYFPVIGRLWVPRFDARYFEAKLAKRLGDMRIGSPEFKTGLCIVAKRVDTGSPWVLTNNPRSKYWQASDERLVANKEYRLADVVRASAAAPHYFRPHSIAIERSPDAKPGLFVDGAVSPFNNPSLQMLMVAGIGGYGLDWELGEDNIMLISVGTGSYRQRSDGGGIPAWQAVRALSGVIGDCEALGLTLLQWMSASPNRWKINGEIGDLSGNYLGQRQGLAKPLLHFQRYDAPLERPWLEEQLGLTPSQPELDSLRDFTNPSNMAALYKIGRAAADKQIQAGHFPDAFNVERATA